MLVKEISIFDVNYGILQLLDVIFMNDKQDAVSLTDYYIGRARKKFPLSKIHSTVRTAQA